MSTGVGFIAVLVLTVLLLAGAVLSGRAGRRRVHLSLVVLTLASLSATIVFAIEIGGSYELESAGWILDVHLALARGTTAFLILPIVTGVRTLFVARTRKLHARVAYATVALIVVTLCTGAAMLLVAEPVVGTVEGP